MNIHNAGRLLPLGRLRWILLLCAAIPAFSLALEDEAKLVQKAQNHLQKRNWNKTIETYQNLLQENPATTHADDARFWIAFCWEQIPGNEETAFELFEQLQLLHPQSPWCDDAVVHQITLAKKLAGQGKQNMKEFLEHCLEDPRETIRQQAAFALGELREPIAISALDKLAGNPDEFIAGKAIRLLQLFSASLEQRIPAESTEQPVPLAGEKTREILSKGLRLKGDSWTEDQLFMNGLYHIVDHEQLAFYLSLESEWDKNEWQRKFWKEKDPTPTTTENEALDEYQRRVLYAYEAFGNNWNISGEYYPPWDSRGELYIKYGPPDTRTTISAGTEEWSYYKYRITFQVSGYRPNTLGQGISFSNVSRYLYRRDSEYFQSEFIRKPRFVFENPLLQEKSAMKNVVFYTDSVRQVGDKIRVRIVTEFPAENLRYKLNEGILYGQFYHRWIIFDEDYNTILSRNDIVDVNIQSKTKIKQEKISVVTVVELLPGHFTMALVIEDTQSDKLGIYRKKFNLYSKR